MSEMFSSIVNGMKDRTSGLYGYLATSFFLFNWDTIYILIFGKETAEKKVDAALQSFHWGWDGALPLVAGSILCVATPFLASLIREIQMFATEWSERQNFRSRHYADDLEIKRKLDIEGKNKEAGNLNAKIDNLNKSITDKQRLVDSLVKRHDDLTAEDSNIVSALEAHTAELKRIEIELAKNKQEYISYNELKKVYDKFVSEQKIKEQDYESKIDKTLGIIKGLINTGYIPEYTENQINSVLEEIGYSMPATNPLRENPGVIKVDSTSEGASKIVSRDPLAIPFPNRNLI
ncbi:hypothetical protein [Serratia sarumanii]|uniref:hypothetical protein n=1 Tax=Serratia sarumanii TaxID=3020826 RepID=UPI003F7F9363